MERRARSLRRASRRTLEARGRLPPPPHAHARGEGERARDRHVQTTLRRAWAREYPSPQCAFEMSMFNVPCNSHYFSQLAALFIDARAE